ncbi:MAG: DedA family protein [Tannerellaceae bacterium]|nr:DedA family protein [Tannerellaceae bacterium]
MEYADSFLDFIFRIDIYLEHLILVYENWIYVILFLIVFCETGLVIAAFLPGDALLFITGTLAAMPTNTMNVHLVAFLLIIAAILGDTCNYWIGKRFGDRLLEDTHSKIFKRKHLERTHQFYEKYGGKTIVLARFIPFVRTFAPFVAGMGRMNYHYFISYNVSGALIWVISLTYAGFYLGGFSIIQNNLKWVILLIIVLSNIPAIVEIIKKRGKWLD